MGLFEDLAVRQEELAEGISEVNKVDVGALGLVAGVDTAYWTGSDGVEWGVCCVVVVDFVTHEVVQSVSAQGRPQVPYRAGFLAFRELPLVEAAVERLTVAPEVFLFDGNGQLHERRMGIATQASFVLNRPTVGVAKTYYRVADTGYTMPADEVGASTSVVVDGQTLGAAVRTRKGVRPVFVSCGNWIDLDTAVAITTSLVEPTSRLPVPLRAADLATHQARRQRCVLSPEYGAPPTVLS